MDKKQGQLIVIDGIDGSGKTTQIELLTKYLSGKNIPFEIINFPRYGDNEYGKLIRRYLAGEFGQSVNPYLVAAIFAGDRLLAKPLIESWLAEGKVVLANRYVSSSKAHLSAKLPEDQRKKFMEWIDQLEYQTNGMPKPDLNILLDVDPAVGQKNALSKNTSDIHEKDLAHEEKAAKIYFELSRSEENWVVVNCMQNDKMSPKEEIHREILKVLSKARALRAQVARYRALKI